MLEIQDVSIVFNQGTFDENKALKNINLKDITVKRFKDLV